ncbi:hypothetical protein RRG08_057153 [Elysia crispata]|uniref:Uncharacterized protein n=1 Tax=Elysia crispata TaxID=231223 RepID=A0AAE1ASG1_9GAST|nr:hypothetical protein RRG08_057153 [Elysia crispata]
MCNINFIPKKISDLESKLNTDIHVSILTVLLLTIYLEAYSVIDRALTIMRAFRQTSSKLAITYLSSKLAITYLSSKLAITYLSSKLAITYLSSKVQVKWEKGIELELRLIS